MRRALIIVLATTVTVTACAGAATGDVTISSAEFSFKPNALRWKVGQQIRITLTNDGQKAHEWVIGRSPMSMPGMARTFSEQFFTGVDVKFERDGRTADPSTVWMTEMGPDERSVALPIGTPRIDVIFTVPDKPGEWEMGCFEDDGAHYDDGMKGKVTVER